ncbi:MAG: glycosyltransferase family 2 protein, partial [Candidatus Bathyarchaeota archaeon]|nr:glycosyltransferase family 2 protein [Candidatus Bathyarchaeota archaeon]
EDPTELIKKFKNKLNITYYRFDENLGGISLTGQWHRCIELTDREEWIMILGDDDELSENCIEAFYNHLGLIKINQCRVVRFASKLKDEIDNKTSKLYTHPEVEKVTDFFHRRFTRKTRSSLSEYLFKREAYKENGFFDYKLGWFSDDRAWMEFSNFGEIFTINTAHVIVRFSDVNISRWNYRMREKEISMYEFFKFVTYNHLNKFDRNQRKDLLKYYERIVYRLNKANTSFYFSLLKRFIKNRYFVECLKFSRRFLLNTAIDQKQ